jgi:hypothetical protein
MADIIVKKFIINQNLFDFSSYLDVGSDYIYILWLKNVTS